MKNLKHRNSLAVLTDESVKKLLDKGYNFSEIGRELGVTCEAVFYYCKVRNWKSNFNYEQRYKFDRKEVLRLYNLGYNDSKIAKELKANVKAIQVYRTKMLNLPVIYKNNFKYSKKEMAFLIGLTLGDGHLINEHNCYAGSFAHSLKQEDYFKWKYTLLSNDKVSKITYSEQFDKRTRKTYYKISTYIKSCLALKNLYDAFYKNREKQIYNKQFILDNFTDLSLAIWYGDDGYFIGNAYHFSTNCFNKESLDFFQKLLLDRYNLKTTIFKNNVMRISSTDNDKLRPILLKYLPKSMRYKIIKDKK